MKLGSAHTAGLYTYPNGSGTQFTDGCNEIFSRGLPVLKIYATADYATADYPLQSSWSSTPTSLVELVQTTQYATQLARAWDTVVFTAFPFANGTTNWWRAEPTLAKFQAEYDELYDLGVHLLDTYDGDGKTFIIQTWENDWSMMDSTNPDTHVSWETIRYYVAFNAWRQRAIDDARKAVVSDCKLLNAYEVNRVLDGRLYPHRKRVINEIASKVKPDVISYSAYDSFIVQQGSWGATYDAWLAATTPTLNKAMTQIQQAFPNSLIQFGEIGLPEESKPEGRSIGDMVTAIHRIVSQYPVTSFIYWEVFDNEGDGYYLCKSDGTDSEASTALAALL